MKEVNRTIPKIDGEGLVCGYPAYTDDLAPADALVLKVLRSPHAFARIKKIDVSRAEALPGVVCVITHRDAGRMPITRAGQGHPEPSPKDKFILDEYVRYIGDEAAAAAAVNEETAIAALKLIDIEYDVFEPVTDFEKAEGHPSVIHPEPEIHQMFPIGLDPEKNVAAAYEMELGDVEKVLSESDVTVSGTWYTQAQAHAAMEPHTAFTSIDIHGRLNVVTSTQNPFHTRRLMGEALGMPLRKIRVFKPRIGGGFGGKQHLHIELLCALVTLKTGKNCKGVYTRREVFESTFTRHPMRLDIRLGSDRSGKLTAIDLRILSDTGAYGEHALTTFMVAGSKTLPLYNKVKAVRFGGKIVYTNRTSSGAYRGYGAIQGNFALESAMDELAHKLGIDPVELRRMNMIAEGQTSDVFKIMGEGTEGIEMVVESCKLDYCLSRAEELIRWKEGWKAIPGSAPGRVRGKGLAIAMQGSGIPLIDMGSATLELQDDGFFKLLLGATDIGTGSDTILAQIAAEELGISTEDIVVYSSDTDRTPYDVGAYASSTTYVSGNAVIQAAREMKQKLIQAAALNWGVDEAAVIFDGREIRTLDLTRTVTLKQFSFDTLYHNGGHMKTISATGSFTGEKSPPPYLAAFAEVEVDTETGEVSVIEYAVVTDCGTPINPALARIQVEGGVLQGIGMTLYEDALSTESGKLLNNSFMTYKIPTRLDVKKITSEFAESHDPSGPFGAKSVGEIGIDTPLAAIANALYNAVGVRLREVPITPEKVLDALLEQ